MTEPRTTLEEQEALKSQRKQIPKLIPRKILRAEYLAAVENYKVAQIYLQEVLNKIQRRSDPSEARYVPGDHVTDVFYNRSCVVLELVGFIPYQEDIGAYYRIQLEDGSKLILHEATLKPQGNTNEVQEFKK